jgi:CRP-like cAMP-binding protein
MSVDRLPRADRPDIASLLARLPLFQELAAVQVECIAAQTRTRHLPKGEILFHQGEESHGFFTLVSGQIKLAFASAQGNEKVVEIIGPRQSFGEAVMFMGRPYLVFAQTLSDAFLLQVPKQTVFDLLRTDSNFARAMLAGLSRRLHSLVADVEAYSLRSGAQRVIGYLLQLHAQQENTEELADLQAGSGLAPEPNARIAFPGTARTLVRESDHRAGQAGTDPWTAASARIWSLSSP